MRVVPPRTPASDKARLRRLVGEFPGKRVLVVGDLMLDQYVRDHVSRISPEAPVPVVRVEHENSIPGGAGNVAFNLASLSASVAVVGVIGADDAGRHLSDMLASGGVAVGGLVSDASRVTSQKCRVVAERQQVVRFDRETPGAMSHETEKAVLDNLESAIGQSEAVILSDYGKGVLSPKVLKTAIALARKAGRPVTVDPKIEHFRRYVGVTCITPNLNEAWGGMRRDPRSGKDELERLGKDTVRTLRAHSVLITRGPDGMSLFKAKGSVLHIPTQAREVFDVTGAGDTVISTLTLALAARAPIESAASLSNHAAGIVVGKLGTATVTIPELLRALR